MTEMLLKLLNLAKKIASYLLYLILHFFRNCTSIRLIIDREKKRGSFANAVIGYPYDLNKEKLSRKYVFQKPGEKLRFLDLGARDGLLTYLLAVHKDLEIDWTMYNDLLPRFKKKYDYHGLDLAPSDNPMVIYGDICSQNFLSENHRFNHYFDVVYSNNVFEHLRKPWIAASNIMKMLKSGGTGIIIAPFSQRHHECPQDYFRYTNIGLKSLFEDTGIIRVLECGYDILGRRVNWQGSSQDDGVCPMDHFGAWRETWFAVLIFEKE